MNHVTFNRYLMFSLCVRRLQMMLCICRTQHVYKILQVHVLCGLCVFFFRTQHGYSSQCQCIPMNNYMPMQNAARAVPVDRIL